MSLTSEMMEHQTDIHGHAQDYQILVRNTLTRIESDRNGLFYKYTYVIFILELILSTRPGPLGVSGTISLKHLIHP